ncbi:UPF0175 family protein [Leptolyngbya cf. ectocarpi LEGE 11479]|uniref:UPF0175 family protein n=1 Tax=Leptolyngbya cf. ectocarpi LEGE 11479 TaxID=1828722 RepID=A0A928ZVG7_LEPEC|nr:UPF0175 family protein [Leptolyngbya ectocarpi]MBE9068218.1 UPF0175 family protein [Leptolyngbya cf. ectocarpi LEGE 11479]
MAVVISDEVLSSARMSETEMLQEIAILLFQREKLTLAQASRLADMPLDHYSLYSSKNIRR